MPRANVIPFPTTPPFAKPRKRGALPLAERQANITSNLPTLMDATYSEIAKLWARQVQMGLIAKMHQLTIPQVEAVIWVAYNYGNHPVQVRRAA
jgi:hypothetical protein